MASSVEGEWNGFTFKFVEERDLPKLYEHLKTSFMMGERTMELIGFEDEYAKDYQQIYNWMFSPNTNEGLSFIAVDNQTGDIAAARLTYKRTRETNLSKQFNFKSKSFKVFLGFLRNVDQQVNVFDHYGVDHHAQLLSASTAPAYRNRGLASEMYRRTLALLRERNFPLAKSIFTSPYTRKCASNFNFETLVTLYHKDHRDENGELVFPNAEPEDCAALMCLKL